MTRTPRRAAAHLLGTLLVLTLVALAGAAPASAAPVTSTPTPSWAPWMACAADAEDNCAQVRAITRTADGTTWLGGLFTHLRSPDGRQSVARQNLAALRPDGTLAPGVAGHTFNGTVLSLATDGRSVYAAGGFTNVDGVGALRLARLDAATGARLTFKSALDGTAHAVAVHGGRVYVGGNFATVQGVARSNLAALDATTGVVDPTWAAAASRVLTDPHPNDPAHNTVTVRDLLVAPDGRRLYVAGDFDVLNGEARPVLAAVSPVTGAVDTTFRAPVAKGQQGFQVTLVDGSGGRVPGVVLATGGQANVAFRLDLDGRVVWRWDTDGDVQAVAVIGDTVYFGGHFTSQRMHVAAFDYATKTLSSRWAPRLGPGWDPYFYGVWTLEAYGEELHAGGVFNTVVTPEGQTYQQPKYVRFNAPGAPGPAPDPSPPAAGPVLFRDDFGGGFQGWTSVGNGFTVGDGLATGTSTGKIAVATKAFGGPEASTEVTVRFRARALDAASKVVLARVQTSGSPSSLVSVFVRPDGVVGYRNERAGVDRSSSVRVQQGGWHELRLRVDVDASTGATDRVSTLLDGAPVASLSRTEDLGTAGATGVQLGDPVGRKSYTVDYDEITVTRGAAL